jgi:hypothetical protein
MPLRCFLIQGPSPMIRALTIAALLLGLLAWPSPAWACSCVPPEPPAVVLARADAVFLGKVTQIDDPQWLARIVPWLPVTYSSADPVYAHFDVSDSWKGVSTTTVQVETAASSASCGFAFEVGKQYIVYAYDSAGKLMTGLCTRTTEAALAAADLAYLGAQPKLTLTPAPSVFPFGLVFGAGAVLLLTVGLSAVWLMRRRASLRQTDRSV